MRKSKIRSRIPKVQEWIEMEIEETGDISLLMGILFTVYYWLFYKHVWIPFIIFAILFFWVGHMQYEDCAKGIGICS
jgi:hypothetical protein